MKTKHRTPKRCLTALVGLCLVTLLCLHCLLPVGAEEPPMNLCDRAKPFRGDALDESTPGRGFPKRTDSPLYRKSVLFCGDSICEASTDDSILSTGGWAGRIGTIHDMDWKNAGLSGASVSTCRGDNRIVRQVKANSRRQYDMVILHGGINDAWDVAPVGALTAADCFDVEAFDTASFAGALEELLCLAKEYYPDAVMGYIINYRCYAGEHGVISDMEDYVAVTIAACEKWGIPYLDMYHDDDFGLGVLKADTTEFLFDNVHPNGRGYDLLTPVVEAWMESLLPAVPQTEARTDTTIDTPDGTPAEPPASDAQDAAAPETTADTEPAGSGCASALTCVVMLTLLTAAACLYKSRTRRTEHKQS